MTRSFIRALLLVFLLLGTAMALNAIFTGRAFACGYGSGDCASAEPLPLLPFSR